jgi:hypothetical protein
MITIRSFSRKVILIWVTILALGISALCLVVVFKVRSKNVRSTSTSSNSNISDLSNTTAAPSNETYSNDIPPLVHMVYFGNSMLLKNDCTGVVDKMIEHATAIMYNQSSKVISQTCLRKGATLTSLWDHDCDIVNDFVVTRRNRTKKAKDQFKETLHDWDFVIMNDQSQGPARESSRSMSIETIKTKYANLFMLNVDSTTPIPIIIQTPAYRIRGVMDTSDLGDFDNFTNAVAEGVREYQQAFDEVLYENPVARSSGSELDLQNRGARIAPVGEAYRWIRTNDHDLYKKLYLQDDFHPSPYGTWLQACIIFITCFHQRPPEYSLDWLPSDFGPKEVPNAKEGAELLQVACDVTGHC